MCASSTLSERFSLPAHHRDPFGRLLVSQSQLEDIPILTSDPQMSQCDVKTRW